MITRFGTRIDPVDSRLKVAAEFEARALATPAAHHRKKAKYAEMARQCFNNAMAADFMSRNRPSSDPNRLTALHDQGYLLGLN